MKYAVIGTNVLVSAMISHNAASPTVKVVEAIGQGELVPLYNEEIITEYNDVLSRAKFGFLHLSVARLIRTLMDKGIMMERLSSGETFLDASDAVFYEVALSKEGSYLVTGNKKHFPKAPIMVTPAEMMEILAK
jgi:putative PIN family toxin of toxin-antitoxin system